MVILWLDWLFPKSGKKVATKQVVGVNPLPATGR